MRLPRLFRFDASAWPREQFAAVLCALVLASAWMISAAVREHAEVRGRYFVGLAKWRAVSPIAYRSDLGALARLGGAEQPAPLRLVVRADAAGGEAGALCPLARAEGELGVPVAWVAFGADQAACVPSARVARPRGALADTVRAQLRDARWVLVDAGSRALYSRRDMAHPDEIRAVARLLAPPGRVAPGEAVGAGRPAGAARGERP